MKVLSDELTPLVGQRWMAFAGSQHFIDELLIGKVAEVGHFRVLLQVVLHRRANRGTRVLGRVCRLAVHSHFQKALSRRPLFHRPAPIWHNSMFDIVFV